MCVIQSDDHVLGPDDANATIIAYCDFQCPYCARAYHQIKQLRHPLEDRVRYVFRHFPLTEKHPLSQRAAEAAETAANQDQFWAMHDLYFSHQTMLRENDFSTYAGMIGLDVPQFKEDLDGRVFSSRVMRDVKSGRHIGVTGTPTFFLNNVLVTDDDNLDQLVLQLIRKTSRGNRKTRR